MKDRLYTDFNLQNRRRGSARHFDGPLQPMHPEPLNGAVWTIIGLGSLTFWIGVIAWLA
jgi:hypothetical protein